MSHARTPVLTTLVAILLVICGNVFSLSSAACQAGIIGYLGPIDQAQLAAEKLVVDYFFQAMPDLVGDELGFINLDMRNTSVNDVAFPDSEWGRVEFEATGDFAGWQDGERFGVSPGPGEPISPIISIDGFSNVFSPYRMPADPFRVGTFSFDFSGLGLTAGDKVTLDISGVDEGGPSRTTSVVTYDFTFNASPLNPDFSTPSDPFERARASYILPSTGGGGGGGGGGTGGGDGAVPEPGTATIILVAGLVSLRFRHRRLVTAR